MPRTKPQPAPPMSLLVHDGELADLRSLLEELGTPFVERRGALGTEDRAIRWDLVIATPKRMLELHLRPADSDPVQIAILEQDSRTLRNSLRRAGITLIVRRPVHRAALRALILHSLYRGPEKRRAARVSIGAPVRYRTGWRHRDAILADLSVGGCRLLTDRITERGRAFVLRLPATVSGGRSFSVKARTLQSGIAEGAPLGTRFVTARFENLTRRQLELLRAAITAHADGPASYAGNGAIPAAGPGPPEGALATPLPVEPEPPAAAAAPSLEREPVSWTEMPAEPDALEATLGAADANEDLDADFELDVEVEDETGDEPETEGPLRAVAPLGGEERRDGPRRALEQRVVALGEEATRVLMGHEISVGGMRVKPTPGLAVGTELDLAVHVESRDKPLVVRARVHRDDGESGLVLRFHELDAEVRRYLNDMMDQLPVVDGGEDGGSFLVTEILAAAQA